VLVVVALISAKVMGLNPVSSLAVAGVVVVVDVGGRAGDL
jgi:hypothetical protein